jgi:hypothetical protein
MRNRVTSFMIGTSVRCYERGNEPSRHTNGDEFVDKLVTKSVSTIRLIRAVNFVRACTKFVTEFC